MAVSNTAELFYQLFNTFLFLAIIVGTFVFAAMAFVLIKYRDRPGVKEPYDAPVLGKLQAPRGRLKTIGASVTLSTIILSVLIFGTFAVIDQYQNPPAGTEHILVTGRRFTWSFQYQVQNTTTGGYNYTRPVEHILRIPVNDVIVLNVTSLDVVHNFSMTDFKLKTDAIPGRHNIIWFRATEVGNYSSRCFELCGIGHATMYAQIWVMQPSDFNAWLATQSTVSHVHG